MKLNTLEMKKIAYLLLFIFAAVTAEAASKKIKGIVLDETKSPIYAANVVWKGTGDGAVTDMDGKFAINRNSKTNQLVISYVGYKSDTITISPNKDYYEIQLNSNVDLSEVVVTERSKATLKPRTTILQTEKITYDELCRAACCNLSESFSTNASVDVSYSDAATGAKQIKMLGLSGAYVQMLTENAPNFRGAASLYGLDYVPAPWMESIQVSKGTSSVKNGYEAVTGQINVEYKKPQTSDPLTVNLFASDAGRMEGNVDGNVMFNDYLGTGLFVHYSNDKFTHDANKDGFLDQPKLEQLNLFNRWYYKKDNFISQIGVKFITETRENGQTKHGDDEKPGMPLYKIGIDTKRGEIFTKNGYIIDKEKNMSVALIASGSLHSQKSHYGSKDLQGTPWDYNTYNLRQDNAYANLMYETEFTRKHKISTGISFNYDGLRQESNLPYFDYPDNNIAFAKYRNEYVTGAYAEYTYNLNDKFVVLAGIRGDYHNQYGFFATPRLHLKWNIIEQLHLRASAGKGYRSVNVLAENNYLFASNRIRNLHIGNDLPMDEAWNYGVTLTGYIPLFGKELTLTGEWFYTDFQKQVVVNMDRDPHAIYFEALKGRSYSSNFQIEANYPVFKGFTLTSAFRWTDARTDYDGVLREKPLTSRYRALLTASYQTNLKKWQFDYTVNFNGPGRMPLPSETNTLWNKDFKGFTMMSAQVTRYFRNWSVYAGGENLLGFTQKNPIIGANDPFGPDFDATMIYGPIHGRKFYVGVRWSIPSKN